MNVTCKVYGRRDVVNGLRPTSMLHPHVDMQ